MSINATDIHWMSRAIQLAEKGRYTTHPNPCVGCVITREGNKLAEGWHYRSGEAHAEVHALQQAGEQSVGATAYVTLEPCHHQGRTGPCTEALIASGIKRVVYGIQDPNPLVSGQGLAALRTVGIQVDGPVLEVQCRELNPGFNKRMQKGLPWVRCKLATSLDGRTAMANGDSQWITGAAARRDVQRLRARSDAILTGIDSVLQDNSRLTLREDELDLPNAADAVQCAPLRVVLDSHWRLPEDAAILHGDAPTLIIMLPQTLIETSERIEHWRRQFGRRVTFASVPVGDDNRLDLVAVLRLLATDYHVNEVLIEAGATLAGAFLQQQLLDELVLYQAPVLLGHDARPLLTLPLQAMTEKYPLTVTDRRMVGDDWRIMATFTHN